MKKAKCTTNTCTLIRLDGHKSELFVLSCSSSFISDPTNPERYHCSHAAGVHTVVLPWISTYQRYVAEGRISFRIKSKYYTVKFLNFQTQENLAVINLKFKQRCQTLGYFTKKMQMESQTVKAMIRLLLL